MSIIVRAVRCPNEALSLTNCAVVCERDFPPDQIKYVEITSSSKARYVFSLKAIREMEPRTMGFSLPMRKWAEISINQDIEVRPFKFDAASQFVSKVTVEADFLEKKSITQEPYDTDQMAKDFTQTYANQAFTVGQFFAYQFQDKKILKITIKEMEVATMEQLETGKGKPKMCKVGFLSPNAVMCFEKGDNSPIVLSGKSKGKIVRQSIINPDWDFQKMGIGGLDTEFNAIFRRAFASRVFPPELVHQLGLKHVRGILLFGPPGTGKTLMARQIGNMLNAREPKIVNGPQILDKYVGESEANIRKLFAEAEEEEKRLGPNSGLHIIIFDEIDAICKARGSVAGNSGVHDTVVNQLLSKIDGVESLNNILVIGMTNRRDMIDEALMRPGRLEVQMEISLPNEEGRLQIINIHTNLMRKYDKLADDVDLVELAAKTKNFSGAEIEGLVRAAQSTAMNRLIKAASKVEIDPEATEKLKVERSDFLLALENDIKPAFGSSAEQVEKLIAQSIISWGQPVANVLEDGELFINQARSTNTRGIVSVLLEGPPNSGKTALAAKLALDSGFPFVKLCTPEDMVGYTETAKCQMVKKIFDDAYKSVLSCIVVDNIERLLDYGPIGPRYSNLVLQALLVLLKKDPPKGKKLLILCTSSRRAVLEEMEMMTAFTAVLHVPNLSAPEHLIAALDEINCFNKNELKQIQKQISGKRLHVGIKKLLAFTDMARQTDEKNRVIKFLTRLEDEGALEM